MIFLSLVSILSKLLVFWETFFSSFILLDFLWLDEEEDDPEREDDDNELVLLDEFSSTLSSSLSSLI